MANFTDGFERVLFSATPVPASAILAPVGLGPPPETIWATFGTGPFFGEFVIVGPDEPGPTIPDTHTIGLPGAIGAIGPAIATESLFVVTARLETFDPGPVGAGAPPPLDLYEYVFGLTDVASPTGPSVPIPFLTITTAPIPEPSTLLVCLPALAVMLSARRNRNSHR